MKKFIILLLVFLSLSFNIITLKPAFAANKSYKQGFYSLSDANILADNLYSINNISKTDNVQVFIFDKNNNLVQNIYIGPNSSNIDATIPLKAEYLFVVVGKGEVTITPKASS